MVGIGPLDDIDWEVVAQALKGDWCLLVDPATCNQAKVPWFKITGMLGSECQDVLRRTVAAILAYIVLNKQLASERPTLRYPQLQALGGVRTSFGSLALATKLPLRPCTRA